jgi:hypothetical protein
VSEMNFKIGTKVRFIEHRTPPGVEPNAVGVIVSIEHDTEPWEPRVRVRFENYLSGWICSTAKLIPILTMSDRQ